MLFKNVVTSGLLAGIILLLGIGSTVQAASACKGMSSSQCSGKSDCVWVGGYTRKDNKKVSGYCRSKGGKGTQSDKAKDKGSSSAKKDVADKESAKKSSNKKSSANKPDKEKSKSKKKSKDKKSKEKSKSDGKKSKSKDKKKTTDSKTAD